MITRARRKHDAAWAQSWSHTRSSAPSDRWLLSVVDAGLAGVLCIAPMFFGGRHDLGRLVFVSLVAVTAVAWFLLQARSREAAWKPTLAHGVLLLAVGLVLFQIVPLPVEWINRLAPRNAELLSLWDAGGSRGASLGSWRTLSLTPHETTKAMAMLLAYSLLFIVVVQRIDDTADVLRLLRWIGGAAGLMACFGLFQYFASNGRFFWFYEHPFRDTNAFVGGSFVNRNHFANFLVLGVGALVACLVAATLQPAQRIAARRGAPPAANAGALVSGAALSIVLFAILLSLSRGGTLALLVSTAVIGAIYTHSRLFDAKYIYSFIALIVVVFGLLSLYGYDKVAQRMQTLSEGSIDAIDQGEGRRKIWAANVAAFRAGWLTGAGVGSHSMVYPVYLPESSPQEYSHAENGYLQIASETGIAGVALLGVGLACCGFWCATGLRLARSPTERVCLGACAAGLAASAVHSLVDFVWYIPACMSVTVILAACTLRLAQMSREASRNESRVYVLSRPQWLTRAAVVGATSLWMVWTFFGPGVASVYWDRYLRVSKAHGALSRQTLDQLIADRDVFSEGVARESTRTMLGHLERVVAWEPQFARAHLRLAAHLVNDFEQRQRDAANPMDVTQIRDAAMASRFASPADLRAWLHRAFGDHCELLYQALHHAHVGVALSPLQGEGYLTLADLCFLEGAQPSAVEDYLDQAIRVRPFDADVLFESGKRKLLAGDAQGALSHWTQCYRDPGPHQLRIIYLLAGRIPAAMFLATFEPDWQTLMPLWKRYRVLGQEQDLQDLVTYALDRTQQESADLKGVRAADRWRCQAVMFSDLGREDESLACLERAYAANPRQYEVRLALGQALLSSGQFSKAEPHLRWCLSRHPENKQLRGALVRVAKARLMEQDEQPDTPVSPASFLNR